MEDTNDIKQFREMVRVLVRKLGVLQDSEFSCCGITLAQCHALVEIGRAQQISLNELAQVINLENSTVSRTVNNLVESGMTVRETDPADRRYAVIALTPRGQALFESIENSMESYYGSIFSQIPEPKKEQVLESLALIIEAIGKSGCCVGDCCGSGKE